MASHTDCPCLSFCFGKPHTTAVTFSSVTGFACYKLGFMAQNFPKEWVFWGTTSGAEGQRRGLIRRTQVLSSLGSFKKPLKDHHTKIEELQLQRCSPLLTWPGKGTSAEEEMRVSDVWLLTWLWGWQHPGAFSPTALPWLFIYPDTECLGKVYQPPVRPWLVFKQNKLYLNTCLEIKCKTVSSCQNLSSALFISSAAVNDIIATLLHCVKRKGGHAVLSRNRKQLPRNLA